MSNTVTVAELIAFLQTQPPEMVVIYKCYSEYKALELDEIMAMTVGEIRADGWVHESRPDKPTRLCLCLPGN